MKTQQIILEQIDSKIVKFRKLKDLTIPSSGWVFAIRQALGMSLRQLGKRMGITPQSVKEIEIREKSGTVSLNVLRQFGRSLDMKLVYGFIPKEQSLEKIIEKRAAEIAEEIVKRTSVSMIIEDQEVSQKRLRKAVAEMADKIKSEIPRYLWD